LPLPRKNRIKKFKLREQAFYLHLTKDYVINSDHIDYTISRYRSQIYRAYDIVAAIYRTISCTNARLSRALLAYRSGGVCV